ncbi:HemK2/MTQ2 family protein methyltransferase [Mycobacterium montefiorense]|uniref:HemK2/MTQ2 family protein methyltransferase n=2 Tax=Mycobacterium montefiorense TaxID=154654 RepID=UPI0023E180E9
MTSTYPVTTDILDVQTVYQPQDDSRLLVSAMQYSGMIPGRRVLDLCTGSGYVAIAAAEMGCASVTAFDICPYAVHFSQGNAIVAGVDLDVREGSWIAPLTCAPFDVVLANPPYVPTPPEDDIDMVSPGVGPSWAWNAGCDGRRVLDPLCASASDLLCAGGSLLLVQSALAGIHRSLDCLRSTGLNAEVVACKRIPFGPVLTQRAAWLEQVGLVRSGCREEELVVIRADKP